MAQVVYSLSEQQKRVLEEVVGLFEQWREEGLASGSSIAGRDQTRRLKGFHPRPYQESNRVVLLDGGRGSGKSSLLLTLVEAWYGGANAATEEDTASFVQRLNKKLGKHAFLPTVDFDPLPDGMPVYVWLLSAFVEICEPMTDPPRQRASGEQALSLRLRLQQLQQTSLLGWTEIKLAGSDEDRLVTRYQSMRNWKRFRQEWHAFVDALVEELESRDELEKGGLLIVPVDDLDMRMRSFRETLLALRQLNHPRVAFLLCADTQQMLPALTYEVVQRVSGQVVEEARLKNWDSSHAQWPDSPGNPSKLARDILDKQVPRRVRKRLPLPSLSDAGDHTVRTPWGETVSLQKLLDRPETPSMETPRPSAARWDLTRHALLRGRQMRIPYRRLTDVLLDMARVGRGEDAELERDEERWREVYYERLGLLLQGLRQPGVPWTVERVGRSSSYMPGWEIRGVTDVVERPPNSDRAVRISANLWRSVRRRFVFALGDVEVDELGALVASYGTGPLVGELGESLQAAPPTSEWSYRFFGQLPGFEPAIPWLTFVGAHEDPKRVKPSLWDGPVPRTDFEALRVWVAGELPDRDTVETDLWTLLERACGVSSARKQRYLDASEAEALGLMVFPESGLNANVRGFVLAFIGAKVKPGVRWREVVDVARQRRWEVIGAEPKSLEGIDREDVCVIAMDVLTDRVSPQRLSSLVPVRWGKRSLASMLGGDRRLLPGPRTFFSRAFRSVLGSVPMYWRWELPSASGGLPHRFSDATAAARDQLAWMWRGWLLGAPEIWRQRYGGQVDRECARMEEVARSFGGQLTFAGGLPDVAGLGLYPVGGVEDSQFDEKLRFYRCKRWECEVGVQREVSPSYYDALVAGVGLLATYAEDESGNPTVYAQQEPLLVVEGREIPVPPLKSWADYDLLFATVGTLEAMALQTEEYLRTDWFLLALVDVVVCIWSGLDGAGTKLNVSLPLNEEAVGRYGGSLAKTIHLAGGNRQMASWVGDAVRVIFPVLHECVGYRWAGELYADRMIKRLERAKGAAPEELTPTEVRELQGLREQRPSGSLLSDPVVRTFSVEAQRALVNQLLAEELQTVPQSLLDWIKAASEDALRGVLGELDGVGEATLRRILEARKGWSSTDDLWKTGSGRGRHSLKAWIKNGIPETSR